MKIKELYIENYKCFQEPFKLSFEDTLNGGILDRALITGANGVGKTTILELIITFLSFYGPSPISHDLMESEGCLVLEFEKEEIEKSGLNIESTIIFGTQQGSRHVKQGIFMNKKGGRGSFTHSDQSIVSLKSYIQKQIGKPESVESFWGGVVYFPHYRSFPESGSNRRTTETPKYDWISIVPRILKGEGSLQNYLHWLSYEDYLQKEFEKKESQKFQDVLIDINEMLFGKQITKIDKQGRILVSDNDNKHVEYPIEELSSGEKHLLLLLLEISRRCWPGSVLLIDEPEISLHPGMQENLLFMLKRFCKKRNIQLIMATHSETIFNLMHPHERFVLTSLEKREVKEKVKQ